MKNQIKPNEPLVLANALMTPDGTILQTYHAHDYSSHKDNNGNVYAIDGGLTSFTRVSNHDDEQRISITSDDDHFVIREWFSWGSYGKSGNEELHWIKLKDLTDEHLNAIIDGYHTVMYNFVFKNELNWRNDNGYLE